MNADKYVNKNIQDQIGEVEQFHLRLKGLIGDESVRSFGRSVGISDTTIRKYLSGETEPTLSRLVTLAKKCNVSIEWLATGEERESSVHIDSKVTEFVEAQYVANADNIYSIDEFKEEYALIPGYHVSVSTGHGTLNNDDPIKRHLAFRRKWLNYRKLNEKGLAVVFASGDSMEPTIYSGNSILVDTADTQLKDGSIYVLRFGENLFAKRLQQRFDNSVTLISDNKEYPEQIILENELEQLNIIGKVVWIGKDVN